MSDRHDRPPPAGSVDWKTHGVKVIPGDQLDPNTAQTPGMSRAAAINLARVGAQKIWAGTVTIDPAALGPHFEPTPAEEKWDRLWSEWGVHRFEEADSRPAASPVNLVTLGLPSVSCWLS